MYGLFIDGDQIIDGVNPDVKVVSTDPDSNTMVVDGGNWGSDNISNWSDQGTLTDNNPGTTGYAQAFNGITDEGETYGLQMGLMVALVGMLTDPNLKMVTEKLLVLTGHLIAQLN